MAHFSGLPASNDWTNDDWDPNSFYDDLLNDDLSDEYPLQDFSNPTSHLKQSDPTPFKKRSGDRLSTRLKLETQQLGRMNDSCVGFNWTLTSNGIGLRVLCFNPRQKLFPKEKNFTMSREIGQESIRNAVGETSFFAQSCYVISIKEVSNPMPGFVVVTDKGLTIWLYECNMLKRNQLLHTNNYLNETFEEVRNMVRCFNDGKPLQRSRRVCFWQDQNTPISSVNESKQTQSFESGQEEEQDQMTVKKTSQHVHRKGDVCAHGNLISAHEMTTPKDGSVPQPRHSRRNGRERCVMRSGANNTSSS